MDTRVNIHAFVDYCLLEVARKLRWYTCLDVEVSDNIFNSVEHNLYCPVVFGNSSAYTSGRGPLPLPPVNVLSPNFQDSE